MKITTRKVVTVLASVATATGLALTGTAAAAAPAAPNPATAARTATAHPDALAIHLVPVPAKDLKARGITTPQGTPTNLYYTQVIWQNQTWALADPWDSSGHPGGSGMKLVLWHAQPYGWFLWALTPHPIYPYFYLRSAMSEDPRYANLVLDCTNGGINARLQVYQALGNRNQAISIQNDSNGLPMIKFPLLNGGNLYAAMPFVAKDGAWVVSEPYSRPTYGRGLDWHNVAGVGY